MELPILDILGMFQVPLKAVWANPIHSLLSKSGQMVSNGGLVASLLAIDEITYFGKCGNVSGTPGFIISQSCIPLTFQIWL